VISKLPLIAGIYNSEKMGGISMKRKTVATDEYFEILKGLYIS
jgi:hypothetical protein